MLFLSSYLSRSLANRWGTTADFTTSFLHSLRFSAFRSSIFHSRPVHSLMLSSHRFLCLPLHLPPRTVPCRIVLASPDDRVTCPYHFSLRLSLQSGGLYMARWRLRFWFSLPHWSCNLCTRYREVCGNILFPIPVSFFQCLLFRSTFHMHTKKYGHGQGTHQSDLGADGDVLVISDDF